jgi:hypothetical protein
MGKNKKKNSFLTIPVQAVRAAGGRRKQLDRRQGSGRKTARNSKIILQIFLTLFVYYAKILICVA